MDGRSVLKSLSVTTLGLLAAACGPAAPAAAPTSAPAAPAPTSAPAAAKPSPAGSPGSSAPPAAASPSASPAVKPAASPATAASPTPAAALSPTDAGPRPRPLAQRATVRLVLNPQGITNLPIELAIDKGYFDQANIDLQVEQNNGSSVQQLPRLARGDLDVIPVTPSAALYNQLTQGFDVKVIGPEGTEKQGRLSQVWLAIPPDSVSQFHDLSDLRDKTIEWAILGSGISVLVELAIRQAGLVNSQSVNLQYRARTLPEIIQLAQSKGADVFGCSEPLATQGVQQGVWVKWKSIADLVPWYQPGLLAGAAQSLSGARRDALVKWMEVYLYACREINASNGVWAPEVLNTAMKWAQVEQSIVTNQGAPPYFDPNGAIIPESLVRVQQLWVELQQVPQPMDVQEMVDTSITADATQHLGRFPA